jgi:selenocysteine lyase/cysteine desulfurase
MGALGIPPDEGVVRLSFVHYTSQEELTRLMEALDQIL